MADASYQRQHLVLHAAGFIAGDGATQTTFGCQMTRIGTGDYALLLDPSSGLIENEAFMLVTPKTALTSSARLRTNNTNFVKGFITQQPGGAAIDCSVEVAVFKSVTH